MNFIVLIRAGIENGKVHVVDWAVQGLRHAEAEGVPPGMSHTTL